MKRTLFIDANIYLRFYDSNSKEFKKLLKSLEEVKKNIFMTSQFQDEIERNKLGVFLRSFVSYEKQLVLNKVSLPEHLEASSDKELKNWNTTTDKIKKKVGEQKNKLRKITEDLIESIADNKDKVSQTLNKIFSSSLVPNEELTESARKRREIGNPPGKNNDPLGDQISWEQLLDKVDKIDELWIVTNDNDYFIEFGRKCYLNPFLTHELKNKNELVKIYCFNTLSESFTSFNESKKISSLPTEKELGEITIEEKKSNQIQNYFLRTSGSIGVTGATGVSGYSGYTGYQLSDVSSLNSMHLTRICDGCGRGEYNPLLATSNTYIVGGIFRTCPFCNSNLCDKCWPQNDLLIGPQATKLTIDPSAAYTCPRCINDRK